MDRIPARDRLTHYTLTAADAAEVNRRIDAQVMHGTKAQLGDVLPFLVTKVTMVDDSSPVKVNGQVILDGDATLWVCDVVEGTRAGSFQAT